MNFTLNSLIYLILKYVNGGASKVKLSTAICYLAKCYSVAFR